MLDSGNLFEVELAQEIEGKQNSLRHQMQAEFQTGI